MVRKMSSSCGSAPEGVVRLLNTPSVKLRGCGFRKWYASLKFVELFVVGGQPPIAVLPVAANALLLVHVLAAGLAQRQRLRRDPAGHWSAHGSQMRQSPIEVPSICMYASTATISSVGSGP